MKLQTIKTLLLCVTLLSSARLFAPEPGPRTFKITNNAGIAAWVYLTAAGWSQIGKGSAGNLAYSNSGVIDSEGPFRLIESGKSTTYQWDDMRMGFCIQSLMVKFQDQDSYTKSTAKNNPFKGCPNQDIYITRDIDGSPIATFNYTKPEDPVDLPLPTQAPPDANQPAAPPLPTSQQPATKESIKAGMNGPKT